MAQELAAALDAAGLMPSRVLREMLEEQPQHRTERRGCGLTQATRLLADRINQPRDPLDPADLALFDNTPQRTAGVVGARARELGWDHGWRALDRAPHAVRQTLSSVPGTAELLALPTRLADAGARLRHPESALLLAMIAQLLSCKPPATDVVPPRLTAMPVKPDIGSCSQAEEFFLEIAHGKIRRGGSVNVFVDVDGEPVLVEKIGLGESHSAMFVREAMLNDVVIPPGGLAALRHVEDPVALGAHVQGHVYPLAAIAQARFLRLTTLAVAPAHRERAFGDQFRRQVQGNMLSPRSTTLDDLRQFATAHARSA